MTIKDKLMAKASRIENYLSSCLEDKGIPERLRESMEYSLMAGGKRLRPGLVLTWAAMLGLPEDKAMPFACGLELIHTYSLIHDDLPAMDDDDLRRGKPSNHKKFDEATAILAGDGLLTEAFGLMLSAGLPPDLTVRAAGEVARAAGAAGMVGGQAVDMEFTGRTGVPLEDLQAMHAMKTGALITVSCTAGAILAGSGEDDVKRAEAYGRSIGVAFQIVDDVLDLVGDEATLGKPVGSDVEMGKTTYPSLIGLDESKRLAGQFIDTAVENLAAYSGEEAEFLAELARYIVDRVY